MRQNRRRTPTLFDFRNIQVTDRARIFRNVAAELITTKINAMPPSMGAPGKAKQPPPLEASSFSSSCGVSPVASDVVSNWGEAAGVDVGAEPMCPECMVRT